MLSVVEEAEMRRVSGVTHITQLAQRPDAAAGLTGLSPLARPRSLGARRAADGCSVALQPAAARIALREPAANVLALINGACGLSPVD